MGQNGQGALRNLRMTLSYDGSGYHGWQRQKGQITVQQVLEEAIGRITGEDILVIGSGRTDAGVHALGQVAHFKTRSQIGAGNLHRGINSLLPEDVVVKELDQVDAAFHARYDATSKIYCYQIWNGPVRSPLYRRYAWFVREPLAGGRMGAALTLLTGTHDFSSFCAAGLGNRNPVRTIIAGSVQSNSGGMIRVTIEADGFLKHMVRNIVGTLVEIGSGRRSNLLFHIGLVEAMSYWKAACCPEIVIRAGHLDDQQLAWYRDLLIQGMGEYFYVNSIPFTHPEFLHISCDKAEALSLPVRSAARPKGRGLLLQSGGKDSALTVQLLGEAGDDFNSLMMNPSPAALEISRMGGRERPIIIRRAIDPKLLEINRAGYLNGHTPFSALLALWGVTCAAMADYDQVMVANERSADENNVEFLGRKINHQYSKSFPFENSFREYCRTYLIGDISFFSLLRPLYELQIAALFAQYPRYFPVFKSCNRNQNENSWCGRCPKCVSTFVLLYPFLGRRELVGIFGRDLFEDNETISVVRALVGLGHHKPFECVGTRQETVAALSLALAQERAQGDVPPVLRYAAREILPRFGGDQRQSGILDEWGRDDHLPARFAALLKSRLGGSA